MTITVALKDEAALMLDDAAVDWSEVDSAAVRRMIAEADTEGGEHPLDDVALKLQSVIEAARRR